MTILETVGSFAGYISTKANNLGLAHFSEILGSGTISATPMNKTE